MKQKPMDWFAQRIIEPRDEIEERNHEASKGLIGFSFFTLLAFKSPLPAKIAAVAWPAIGLLVLYIRLGLEAKHYKSSRWTEFLIGSKLWAEMVMEIYLWPLQLLFILIGSRDTYSYRNTLRNIRVDTLIEKLGNVGHAFDSAERMFGDDVDHAAEKSRTIEEMPGQVLLTAKTTGVCGATVMTMATSAAGAASAASPVSVTPTNRINISATGWATVVGDIPAQGKPKASLEYARAFVTVSDETLNTSFFTELALDAFQTPTNPDVLKRFFFTFNLDDKTTVNVGRMFVAGGWIGPGPTDLETVDYFRFPFTFQGYAAQVDMTRGPWHFLADISGVTGLSFLDGGQFDTIEHSGHLSRSFGPAHELGLTWQVSEKFARVAVTGSANPLPRLTTRGMFYYDHEVGQGQRTSTIGCYGFASVQPFHSIPWLSVHGQADGKIGLDHPEQEPLTVTIGMRATFSKRHSFIMDYRSSYGSAHAGDSDGVRMAWQTTF